MRQFPAVVAPSLGVWKKNQSVQDPPINALSLNLGAGRGGERHLAVLVLLIHQVS